VVTLARRTGREPVRGPDRARVGARWRDDLRAVLAPWFLTRLLTLGALAFAHVVWDRLHDLGFVAVVERPVQLHDGLLAWDGTWYRDIANHGYGITPDTHEALRFFPLWPLLARVVSVGAGASVALVVLANAFGLLLLVLVRRLVIHERGPDSPFVEASVWLLSLAPVAFVFALGYSEALSTALAVAALWMLRRRAWWWAALWGVLLGLTRPFGMLFAVAALVEAARDVRLAPRSELAARVAAVAAPFAGAGAYLVWVWAEYGDALEPFRVQSDRFGRGFAFPVVRWWDALADGVRGDVNELLHAGWVVVLALLLVVLARRWPASYTAFAAVVLVLALSADNINSLERYCLSAFPFVFAAADVVEWLRGRVPRVHALVLPVAAAGLLGYATLAFLGGYVP
jgi:hypothetical protein